MKSSIKNFKFKNYFKNNAEPFFIAEIGVNHGNDLNLAERIIKQAKKGGAQAVKFQTYKAELLASKISPYYWDLTKVPQKSQFKLFKKFDKLNFDDYVKLKKICDHYKIIFTSTPFDNDSAIFLNKLVPFFKIASADLTNLPLIQLIKEFKKPMVISTGACTINEINNLDNYLNNNIEVSFLHCVLSYPTKNHDANLQFIDVLKKKFPKRIIGYSDHTMPDKNMLVLTEAYKEGAQIIEKHFTLDTLKGKKNNDHFHSMDFKDLQKFFENLKFIKTLYNKNNLVRNVLACEKKSRKNARRSIFTRGIIEKQQKIKIENLIAKRPGTGISPLLINKIINRRTNKKLKDDYKIKWSDLKKL